jgi:hypothetical protein
MTEVVKALPNLASKVMHLKEDHKAILDQSEELCRMPKKRHSPGRRFRTSRSRFSVSFAG